MAIASLRPGEELDPLFQREAAIANATRAAELQNQFLDRQRQILHTGPDALLSKSGRDAILGADDALTRLEAARRETLAQAANTVQRRLLQLALDDHRLIEHGTVGDHVSRQSLVWRNTTAALRLEQLRHQAALDYADPGAIDALDQASESAAQEQARTSGFATGRGSDLVAPEDSRSSIWRSAIDAALGKMDFSSAILLYNRAADRLSPADVKVLTPQIEAAREREIGQDYLARLGLPDTQDLVELDSAHQAATTQNNADWPDNPSQRATNQHFIDVAFGRQNSKIIQAKADLDRAVDDWFAKRTADGQRQVGRPPLPIWAMLDSGNQERIDQVLKDNAGGASDPVPPNSQESPHPAQSAEERNLGRDLLQSTVDTVPGAYYARLAQEAFRAGNYGTAAAYSGASLLDAAVGLATFGSSAEIKAAIGAAAKTIGSLFHGSASGLEKAAAAAVGRIKRLPEGSFSIIDWTGYPEHLPKPKGPFRLLQKQEYKAARRSADTRIYRIDRIGLIPGIERAAIPRYISQKCRLTMGASVTR